jgi:small subunit ribosomal protein S1
MTEHDENPSPPQDFGKILDEFEKQSGAEARGEGPKTGDKVSGKVMSITDQAVFVDLGGKSEGQIASAELKDREGNLTVKIGDLVEATVAGTDSASGALVLRRRAGGGSRVEIAEELRQAHQLGLPVEGTVSGFNKGGIEVKVAGLRGFCPLSQIDRHRVEDPAAYVGQKLSFKVTQLEEGSARRRPNIVLSRRALLEDEDRSRQQEARARLTPGVVVRGKVRSLTGYGAFVDLGGVDGMLHVSEIAHARLAHPSEVLKVGDEIEVKVLKIEPGKDEKHGDRISLSRRALLDDPWRDATQRFAEGWEGKGRVVRVESYGAFVELSPGVDGLVHISQLAQLQGGRRLQHAREAVELGQDLEIRVLSVDEGKRRISLGLPGGAFVPAAAPPPVADERPVRGPHDDRGRPGREGGREGRGAGRGGRPGRERGERGRERGERHERGDRHERDEPEPERAPEPQGSFGSLGDFFNRSRNR